MEEFGFYGFTGTGAVAKKRRSATSRRPRLESRLFLGRDPSPPSSTPSSENASNPSTDGSSDPDANFHRKEMNVNCSVHRNSSLNRHEVLTASKRYKKVEKSFGEFNSGPRRSSRSDAPNHILSDSRQSKEGALAPANWKIYTKRKERISTDCHIGNRKSASELASNSSTENKLRKVKLKLGGVTCTLHAKSGAESGTDSALPAKPRCSSDKSWHRQQPIPKEKSDDDPFLQDKGNALHGVMWKDLSDGSFSSASKESSGHSKQSDGMTSRKQLEKEQNTSLSEPVRKSKRVPKRRVLDNGAFDGEDEDDEIRYLKRLKSSKSSLACDAQNELVVLEGVKKQKSKNTSKQALYKADEDFSLSQRLKEARKRPRSDQEPEDTEYVEEEEEEEDDDDDEEEEEEEEKEEEADSDPPESKSKKQRRESLHFLFDNRKELNLTTRQRALQSSKDGSSGGSTNLIEFPDGLPPAPPRKQKGKLSEVEQQLKKAEAAQRRRMQVEKAARESEAEAIRKILGQDSSRKKREEKLQKQRDDLAQEKAAKYVALAANSVRWIMGPSGTIVTFPETVGLPSILDSKRCSYPPPREKCAGPLCTNSYKYRDSKSNLPLCSLQCYRAVQQIVQQ